MQRYHFNAARKLAAENNPTPADDIRAMWF